MRVTLVSAFGFTAAGVMLSLGRPGDAHNGSGFYRVYAKSCQSTEDGKIFFLIFEPDAGMISPGANVCVCVREGAAHSSTMK